MHANAASDFQFPQSINQPTTLVAKLKSIFERCSQQSVTEWSIKGQASFPHKDVLPPSICTYVWRGQRHQHPDLQPVGRVLG